MPRPKVRTSEKQKLERSLASTRPNGCLTNGSEELGLARWPANENAPALSGFGSLAPPCRHKVVKLLD